jgi:2,5-diamino-6-(ribosylamino)-4(3H)-pyrimidinone 5'-phosphate reductase
MPTPVRSATSRPYVVAHVAIALDGVTTGFEPDVAEFYELARTWEEDVTLAGADTILAQEKALVEAPRPGRAPGAPLLAVVDGRGRVRQWEALREVGHWSDVLALHAEATPPRPPDRSIPELVVGAERVDLRAALEALGRRHGAGVVRVDSGGALVGALLSAGLLDELSLLVHPRLAGAQSARRWHGSGPLATGALELVANETLDGDLVWLRYRRGR